jgi:hypothetical protein
VPDGVENQSPSRKSGDKHGFGHLRPGPQRDPDIVEFACANGPYRPPNLFKGLGASTFLDGSGGRSGIKTSKIDDFRHRPGPSLQMPGTLFSLSVAFFTSTPRERPRRFPTEPGWSKDGNVDTSSSKLSSPSEHGGGTFWLSRAQRSKNNYF